VEVVMSEWPLSGQVALVAGATRGAGRAIAVELARAGFYVYATGRSSRASGPSEMGRPETIETDGSRPDCWGYLAAYGWEQQDGHGIDEFR
jgi:NAD(P)-dependent dehydrogenase (short-subunit alcohol dehydrogenase family)